MLSLSLRFTLNCKTPKWTFVLKNATKPKDTIKWKRLVSLSFIYRLEMKHSLIRVKTIFQYFFQEITSFGIFFLDWLFFCIPKRQYVVTRLSSSFSFDNFFFFWIFSLQNIKFKFYLVLFKDAYTTDDIKYEWKLTNPIQQKEGLRQSLPSFELQDVLTDYCTSKTNTGRVYFIFNEFSGLCNKNTNYLHGFFRCPVSMLTISGEYSCLRTKMILRREFSYYLLQVCAVLSETFYPLWSFRFFNNSTQLP